MRKASISLARRQRYYRAFWPSARDLPPTEFPPLPTARLPAGGTVGFDPITPGDWQPKEVPAIRLNHHQSKTALALSLTLSAIAPTAASARFDLNPPRATTTPSARPAVQIVRVSAPGGFDWGDAGIGAAGALGLSMLVAGGGVVITARRRRTPRPSSSQHDTPPHQEVTGDLGRGPDTKSKLV